MSDPNPTPVGELSEDAVQNLVPTCEIDASCRWPVLFLFTKASFWLALSGILWLVSSIQLFSPDFWSVCPWITVGRLRPAAWNIFIYGFTVPSGLGVLLWMLARLGNAPLKHGGMVIFSGVVWNLGVLAGLYGILRGDNTGFSWLEFPRYSIPLLFFAYLVVAIVAVINFTERRREGLYVSQWFLLAALFWFPWIYSTANLLLVFKPVRGVVQVVVDGWYKAAFGGVWLASIGLAVIYYLVPKLVERPLYSRSLASLGFWTMLFFFAWRAVVPDAPVPAWIASASTAGALLTVIPILAFAINILSTTRGALPKGMPRPELLFVIFASVCYVVIQLASIWAAKRASTEVIRFTLFGDAQQTGLLYGFGAMSLFAAIYWIVPKLLELDGGALKYAAVHFWTSAAGVALLVFVFAFGGLVQGNALNDPHLSLVDIAATMRSYFAAGILGVLLLLVGQITLAFELCSANCAVARSWLCESYVEATRGAVKPAGAKV